MITFAQYPVNTKVGIARSKRESPDEEYQPNLIFPLILRGNRRNGKVVSEKVKTKTKTKNPKTHEIIQVTHPKSFYNMKKTTKPNRKSVPSRLFSRFDEIGSKQERANQRVK
jgi:hypothetical protein